MAPGSCRNASLELVPPHGTAKAFMAQLCAACGGGGGAHHSRRVPGALVHLPLVAHAHGLCAENEEVGREAVTEEAVRCVRHQGRAADALPGRDAASPRRRMEAAKPGLVRPAGHNKHDSSVIALDGAPDRAELMKVGEHERHGASPVLGEGVQAFHVHRAEQGVEAHTLRVRWAGVAVTLPRTEPLPHVGKPLGRQREVHAVDKLAQVAGVLDVAPSHPAEPGLARALPRRRY